MVGFPDNHGIFLLKMIIKRCEMGVPRFTETPKWPPKWKLRSKKGRVIDWLFHARLQREVSGSELLTKAPGGVCLAIAKSESLLSGKTQRHPREYSREKTAHTGSDWPTRNNVESNKKLVFDGFLCI